MRNIYILAFVLLISLSAKAQFPSEKAIASPTNDKLGLYFWKKSVTIVECDVVGVYKQEEIQKIARSSQVGDLFRVILNDATEVVIEFLDFVKANDTPTEEFYLFNSKAGKSDTDGKKRTGELPVNKRRYFKITRDLLDKAAMVENYYGSSLSLGVLSLPFRYRPQNGFKDVSGTFNLGAGLGIRLPHLQSRRFRYSILAAFTVSNTVLDESVITQSVADLSKVNNLSAFSFSVGFLAEYEKVQAGLFFGCDRISRLNDLKFDWVHQGKPWISIGFGLAIFSNEKESDNSIGRQVNR